MQKLSFIRYDHVQCLCVYVCVCAGAYTYEGQRRTHRESFDSTFHCPCLGLGLSVNLELAVFMPVHQVIITPCPLTQTSMGYRHAWPCLALNVNNGNQNSSPHMCSLVLYQLDASWSHLGRENLNWEDASVMWASKKVHRAFS